jgi:enoyl-CoA hydratase/carnithine racemase
MTLNRPEARNALSDRLTPALRRMIKQCGDDPRVGALLITGAGNAFCAGGDVKGMGSNAASTEITLEQRVADLRTKQRTLTGALVAVRKPTIAALPGPAAGAGLALALACDIRIAAESAIMATGYVRIGLTGDYGIAWLLTRLAGTSRARELMFLSERIDARRCEALGLVNRVVPDAALAETALVLAKSLAEGPSIALAYIKDNLDHAVTSDFLQSMDQEADHMVRAARTTDHKEAVRAFIDKRKPAFIGQ